MALKYYDIAVAGDIDEAYSGRAFVLQGLSFDYDAIEDFTKAISNSPDDANMFFGRHLSKSTIGDFTGAVNDIEHAIELSKVKSKLNAEYDDEIQN